MTAPLLSAFGAFIAAFTPPTLPPRGPWPASLSAHVVRGLALAIQEETAAAGLVGGCIASGRLAWTCINELVLFPLGKIPFAVETLRYRARHMQPADALEVYSHGGTADGPLVVYFHGGSWGQGAPWQYALLARRLLENGASRVAVARYSLFPEGDVEAMLKEVGDALAWSREQQRAAAAEGAPGSGRLRVVLAGQSAGAHLCALFLARHAALGPGDERASAEGEAWLPDRFVALSGVFDIADHFAHERSRLVHWCSPMWLAMIGKPTAAATAAAADAVAPAAAHAAAELADGEIDGEIDADALSAAGLSCTALARASDAPGRPAALWRAPELKAWAAASPTRLLRLRRLRRVAAEAARSAGAERAPSPRRSVWPPTVVLHARDDRTVPISSAREYARALLDAGALRAEELRVEEAERGGHGEIMVALMSRSPLESLPAIAREFVREVTR